MLSQPYNKLNSVKLSTRSWGFTSAAPEINEIKR